MHFLIMIIVILSIPVGFGFVIYKLFKFIFSPLTSDIEVTEITEGNNSQAEGTDDILKVAIKQNNINTSRIIEYTGEEVRRFEFRPLTWEQFISQDEAKERAKTIIKKAERGIRSHFILSAIRGHGKTTFVEVLAKNMNAKMIQRVGKQIDEDNLVDIINEINTSEKKHVIFFVDEIDTLDPKVLKVMNIIVEQFKINEKKIKPFIFACATISKDVLIKNNPDFLDRLQHHIQFTRYSAKDITKIITQYKNQLYSQELISIEVLNTIANNCKFNPRTAIALLEDFVVEEDIIKVLKNCHIIKDGLNIIDIDVLKALNNSQRVMGANALAMKVGLGQNQYLREYEPFLVEFGYIERVPSRLITEKGKQLLKEVN